ncbi:hypothetical protein [Nocardioides lijunqiniae]|uniref:hypothetical protein n=1 Tax=Nocardioides lijunqiniae TaxID=2760832 RepID=UPI001877E0D8|nr:hypothetical protein [Nocardioides lijunqiniae]
MTAGPDRSRLVLLLVAALMLGLIGVAWAAGGSPDGPASDPANEPASDAEPTTAPTPSSTPDTPAPSAPATPVAPPPPATAATLPGGRTRVFGGGHFLVAYYGTAGTGSLGVLGETGPDQAIRRLRRAARPFARPGRPVQPVYELIVTVADGGPGPDGDFSHDIDRAAVRSYVRAAHRDGALLLLDLQPGRSDFLTVAKRWEWALRQPHVGLALDPEWRMKRRERPGQVIGSVRAREVNRVSAWLSQLTATHQLPEKLFVLHQFRTSMIEDVRRVRPRAGLAMVQHVDGFGTRTQKRATYGAVARPSQFSMGFKLFYDEDVNRMGPREVHRLRPRVRFISFQ